MQSVQIQYSVYSKEGLVAPRINRRFGLGMSYLQYILIHIALPKSACILVQTLFHQPREDRH